MFGVPDFNFDVFDRNAQKRIPKQLLWFQCVLLFDWTLFYSYGHLLVITGSKWDYAVYKWVL